MLSSKECRLGMSRGVVLSSQLLSKEQQKTEGLISFEDLNVGDFFVMVDVFSKYPHFKQCIYRVLDSDICKVYNMSDNYLTSIDPYFCDKIRKVEVKFVTANL